jgi:hypothetical protein
VHVTLSGGTALPFYSKQLEMELFDCYFDHVHPLYPVLNKYEVLQDIRLDKMTLGLAFKSAVMALALLFSDQHDRNMAASFYQYVLNSLEVDDEKPYLEQIQTLLLLYKYQEVITPVGTPLSSVAISHLRDALRLIDQFNRESINQFTIQDEFVCRAHWILYLNLTFSNAADPRINSIAKCCAPPARLPCLTEMEQYNKVELGTTCNLVYLVNITILFSQVMYLIEDSVPTSSKHARFRDLTNRLDAWKKSLPEHILVFLTDPTLQQFYQQNGSSSPSLSSEQSCSNPPTSFITYLCLVYTLLRLMIVNFGSMPVPHDLSEITLSLCYKAHALTAIGKTNDSFLASIQGSRLVSFALTLGLQLYQCTKYNPKDIQPHNLYPRNDQKLNDCCTLISTVFDQLSISPQLYMAVQSFKGRLGLALKKSSPNNSTSLDYAIYNNNTNSNSNCDSDTRNSNSDHSNRQYGSYYLPPMNSNLSSESIGSYSIETNPPHHQEQYSESQSWSQYSNNNQWSGSNNHSLAWEMMVDNERPREDFFQMPLTPTFDMPSNPLIITHSNSQSHQQNTAISLLPFDSIPSEHYYRESCRFKNMST